MWRNSRTIEYVYITKIIVHANKIEKIRNVVFMGMGEPLDNYTQVLAAIHAMADVSRYILKAHPARFGLSPSRISISTVGVVPRIRSLIKDAPQVGLALSLHAPNQTLRTQIVPSSKAWHIDRIMDAMQAFVDNQNQGTRTHRRHVLVEYVLIADINDSLETAHELGLLLQGRDVLLNVIPYNPTQVPFDYKPPSIGTTRAFVDTVKGYGVHTLQRQELGQDIASACGQLVITSQEKSACSIGDLEDLGRSKTKHQVKRLKQQKSHKNDWILALIVCLLGYIGLKWFVLKSQIQ